MSDRLSKATDEQLGRALTRLGSGMEPPAGEGLLDRVEEELTGGSRDSRFNWRRLLVAALALGVAGVGTLLAVQAFRPDPAPRSGVGGEPTTDATEPSPSPSGAIPSNAGFYSVWPELSRYEAETAQEKADAGDPEVQWRLDPDEVARKAVEDSGYRHPVATVERTDCCPDGSLIYRVTTEAGEVHEVEMKQLIRQDVGGIWSVTGIRSRLVIKLIDFNEDGATTVDGEGAPPGARIGYYLHRACPPEFAGTCGYTDELRSVAADADGRFHIEDSYPGWSQEPGVFAVWVIEESNEGSRFGPITLLWLPSGEFPAE